MTIWDHLRNKEGKVEKVDFCIALFEALPIPVLVVDPDVRILFYNSAAVALVGSNAESVIRHRAGEILHCIHSKEAAEGCGYSPFCKDCIIRNSVNQSFTGQTVSRKLHRMELLEKNCIVEINLLVTSAPIQYGKEQLVMVLLEDINELIELRRLIPICAHCKKIRDDQEYWHHVENYLKEHLDMDFTHSICPECMVKLYPGYAGKKNRAKKKWSDKGSPSAIPYINTNTNNTDL